MNWKLVGASLFAGAAWISAAYKHGRLKGYREGCKEADEALATAKEAVGQSNRFRAELDRAQELIDRQRSIIDEQLPELAREVGNILPRRGFHTVKPDDNPP